MNVDKSDFHQADKVPVTSDNVVENHQADLSSDIVVELDPSHVSQQNSTANSVYNSSASCDGVMVTANSVYSSSESSDGSMSDVTVTADIMDLPNDMALLSDADIDEHPPQSPNSVSKHSLSESPVAFNVEDYLLSDAEGTGRALTNGCTNTDSDKVGIVAQNNVAIDVTTADVPHVPPDTVEHATWFNDIGQTVDMSSSINGALPAKLITTCEMAQNDAAMDETSTSLRCNDTCVNGHLQSTTHDADVPCHVCRSPDDPPTSVHSDVNSNVTSHTSAISTSGDDGELDEIESRDIEKCQRVAERLSAAWSGSVQRVEVLDSYDHDDADLLPPTSPTLTTRSLHVR